MSDNRNTSYPPHDEYDNCQHEWEDVESMMERAVECTKCGVPGQREKSGDVFWPAT